MRHTWHHASYTVQSGGQDRGMEMCIWAHACTACRAPLGRLKLALALTASQCCSRQLALFVGMPCFDKESGVGSMMQGNKDERAKFSPPMSFSRSSILRFLHAHAEASWNVEPVGGELPYPRRQTLPDVHLQGADKHLPRATST